MATFWDVRVHRRLAVCKSSFYIPKWEKIIMEYVYCVRDCYSCDYTQLSHKWLQPMGNTRELTFLMTFYVKCSLPAIATLENSQLICY